MEEMKIGSGQRVPASTVIQWLLALAMLVATIPGYSTLFATTAYRFPLSCAVFAGIVPALLARWMPIGRLRVSALAGVLIGPVVWLLVQPGPRGSVVDWPVQQIREVMIGIPLTLTLNRPADVGSDVLVVPFLLTFALSWATFLLLRSSAVLLPVVPPLLALVAQLLLVAGDSSAMAVIAGAFVLPAVLVILLRASHAQRSGVTVPILIRTGAYLAVVAIVVAGGVVGVDRGLAALDRDRYDPSAEWRADLVLEPGVTPLSLIKPQLIAKSRDLFQVRLTVPQGTAPPDRISVASLDRFDGQVWTVSADLRIAGSVLRPQGRAGGRHITADFTIFNIPGNLLPSLEHPLTLDRFGSWPGSIAFDPRSGLIATTAGPIKQLTYRQTAPVTAPAPTKLTGQEVEQYTELSPSMKAQLQPHWQRIATGQTTPVTELRTLETYLRNQPYNPKGPAGHSMAALLDILEQAPKKPQARYIGYAEQHAAAFAVMARARGLPARVVVGYRLRPHTASDTRTVRSDDAHAWAEVYLNHQWTMFDPTDVDKKRATIPGALADAPIMDPPPPPPPPPFTPPVQVEQPESGGTLAPWRMPVLLMVVLLAALLLLMLTAALATPITKYVRRRRRIRRGEPTKRLLGAWDEATDQLRAAGLVPQRSWSRAEVARQGRQRFSERALALTPMARLVTTALYAPDEPNQNDVNQAWMLEAELRRQMRAPLSWPARVRTVFDPRTLVTSSPRRSRAGKKESR